MERSDIDLQRLVRRLSGWREELKERRNDLGDVGHPDANRVSIGEASALGTVESELDEILSEFTEANDKGDS